MMKIVFLPKTKSGKWSAALFGVLVLLVCYFLLMVNFFGQRGGAAFFSNLNLTIPMLLAWLCGLASFVLGTKAIFADKSYSVWVMLTVLLAFLTTLYGVLAVL